MDRSGLGWLSRAAKAPRRNALRFCAALLGAMGFAVAIAWVSPAYALPSFSGQTGLPCSTCHVGGFGGHLTPFGIQFKMNGYTLGGGSGPWSHMPLNLQFNPSYTNLGKDRPTAPAGFGTNNFVSPSCGSFLVAAGKTFDSGSYGLGGIGKVWLNLTPLNSGGRIIVSEGPSDFKITKPVTLKNGHPLLLGFDLNNKATQGDPWDASLYGQSGPVPNVSYLGSNTASGNAGPILGSIGTSNYGASLFALWDNSLYAQVGIYQTFSNSTIRDLGKTPPPGIGVINGAAPYFRVAWQQSWADSYLEIGGLYFDAPLNQIVGITNPAAQNEFRDWGLDVTYHQTLGENSLMIGANYLHEDQDRSASFGNVPQRATNPSDFLNQYRVAASYDWNSVCELTLAYQAISGSVDAALYPTVAFTGSAAHSPETQAIIVEFDWTPNANNTGPGFPWSNVRYGLQYRYYLEFNGGTTNYDGSGRNATDNNALIFYTMWSF